ncbi:MAG: hypothetical protein WC682_05340 [Parcubacteria group bacterium]|jgi:hypothetical protein
MDNDKKQFFSLAKKSKQTVLLLNTDKKIAKDVKKLRDRYLTLQKNAKDKDAVFENLMAILDEVEKLRIKYELSEPHFIQIAWLVQFDQEIPENDIEKMYKKSNHRIIKNEYGENIVYLPIYPETTIKDLGESFNAVKEIAKKFYWGKARYKRLKSRRKLQHHLNVFNYKKSGLNDEEVKRRFNEEVAVDNRDIIVKNDVPKIVKNLTKGAKKLLKNKHKN